MSDDLETRLRDRLDTLKSERDEARAERDALVEATKLTVPIAALNRMLAEARAKGMEEAAEIARDYAVWHHPLSDYEARVMQEHGKRAASHIENQIRARAAEVREGGA